MRRFSFQGPGLADLLKACTFLLIPVAGGGKEGEPYAFISLLFIPVFIFLISKDRSFSFPRSSFPFALFVLYTFISTLWSRSPYMTLEWSSFMLIAILLIPFNNTRFIEYSIIFVSIGLIIHFLSGGLPYTITKGRANFTFFHPNSAVGFLLPASVLSFRSGFNLYLFIPALLGVFATGSRAGFMLFFLFSLYMIFRRRLAQMWVISGILILFSISIFLLKGRVYERSIKTSLNARLAIWQDSFDAFSKNPLIGYGAGTFEKVFPAYQKRGVFSRFSHSSVLENLFAGGIIGLLLFLFSICYPLLKGKVFPLSCAPLFLHSLIDFSLSAPANMIILYLLLFSEDSEGFKIERRKFKILLLLLTLFTVSFSCSQFLTYTAKKVKDRDLRNAARIAGLSFYFNPTYADGCILASNLYLESSRRGGRNDDFEEALKFAKRAVSIEGKVYSTHFLLATVYLYKDMWKLALNEFRRALSLYPQYPKLRLFYARALMKFGFFDKVERIIDDGLKDGEILLKARNPEVIDVIELYYLKLKLYISRGDEIGARLLMGEADEFAKELSVRFSGRRTSFGRSVDEVMKDMELLFERSFGK